MKSPKKFLDRAELIWLMGAVVFASILRLAFPGRMAVEHFDEGVYASNFWFGGEAYPAQHLYAPPLLPAVIEWTMIIASLCGIKPTGWVPIVPSLIAGIATVPSIWWVCRRWFGSTAALTSAWLVATSDFHVCYSRAALTDVPVCFFMLWAAYFIWEALSQTSESNVRTAERGRPSQVTKSQYHWRAIALAGSITALAWWTKYNGWLPLAIGAAGGVLWQLLTPPREQQFRRALICWGLIAVIAFVLWTPVLWGLQRHGGYSSVIANHRHYVVGLKGWCSSAWTQLYNIGAYENPLEFLVAPFKNLNSGGSDFEPDFQKATNNITDVTAGFGFKRIQEVLIQNLFPLVVPIVSLILTWQLCLRNLLKNRSSNQLLQVCLSTAWFGGLTLATPLYYPYPRLVLPWLLSTWICLGFWWQTWRADQLPLRSNSTNQGRVRIVVALLILVSTTRLICGSANAWRDRTSLQRAAIQFASSIKRETSRLGFLENNSLTFVIAEPAIVFGIAGEGLLRTGPQQNFDFILRPVPEPMFVVVSNSYLSSMPQQDRDRLAERFVRVTSCQGPKRSHLVFNEPHQSIRPDDELVLYRFVR